MGKNNVLAAQRQLFEEQGLEFNLSYGRRPFFLRRDIAAWHADRGTGLPTDATRGDVADAMGWKERGGDGRIGGLFRNVGLTPFWGAQEADTMDSHRLAWHAAHLSPETGERMWRALSERYFEGKHTQIHPIRLDSHALLLECAEEAGIDREDAQRVLMSGAYEAEVHAAFLSVQKMGIKSPVKRLEPWSFDAHSCSCPPDPKALPPKALPLRPFLSRGQSSIPVRQARSPSSSSKSKG